MKVTYPIPKILENIIGTMGIISQVHKVNRLMRAIKNNGGTYLSNAPANHINHYLLPIQLGSYQNLQKDGKSMQSLPIQSQLVLNEIKVSRPGME